MLRVSNKPCIRELARKSFKAAKMRNLIAILAIALTTLLFTALFTVGLSMNEGFQQSNFRQVGGYGHGGFKYLTEEQFQELREDPLIKECGVSRVLGFAQNEELRKNHVEVRWNDTNAAHWMFLDPIEGKLPQEGTNEAATDLEILRLLGVEAKLGAEFSVLVDVNGKPTQQTFTLCGWWEKDPAITANHILIPESRVDAVLNDMNISLPTTDKLTGSWNLEMMFKNANHIQDDLDTILENHGYQSHTPNEENYINDGVNWGYTGAQMSQNIDPITMLIIVVLLLLIVLTGYLIIYNVFRISVVNDIRFYGLLKTIGTTGKQIKSILRRQALMLCVVGIPLGCFCGWFVGAWISPLIMRQLNGFVTDTLSISPLIFVFAMLFALFTVLLSCARPGRLAAKVSPVEAVHYTEGGNLQKKQKKGTGKISVLGMAWANLGRSKGKTFITILSLTLAVALLQMTTLFTNGFDMDKYLQDKAACDFILADGGYFENNVYTWSSGSGILPEKIIDEVSGQEGITNGGRIYGQLDGIQQFAPEEWVRQTMLGYGDLEETVNYNLSHTEHTADGRVMDRVQTYGMEAFILDKLTVVEGDLSRIYQPGSRAVAAVCSVDDYGKVEANSHWARLGDTVTLRYPTAWEFYNPDTGEIYENEEAAGENPWQMRPSVYHDETFTVEALVLVPSTLSYRYYGADAFVLNAETFQELTGKSDVMLSAFDAEDSAEPEVEEFLHDYTEKQNPRYGYESKQRYVKEFESFRSMFLIVGGLLSFIVGLVGVLNFVNAILTGILTRKRELAMLQSIGMTGRQLKTMLVAEGLLYALGSVALALVLSITIGPLAASVLEKMFWFFTYRPTFIPILIVAPIFALVGLIVPLLVYRSISKQTIVERLRENEA